MLFVRFTLARACRVTRDVQRRVAGIAALAGALLDAERLELVGGVAPGALEVGGAAVGGGGVVGGTLAAVGGGGVVGGTLAAVGGGGVVGGTLAAVGGGGVTDCTAPLRAAASRRAFV
jgi:hypothetical protein